MAAEQPVKVTIRMYRVGFGDCFLLSFAYKRAERHVLIDFGSTGGPKDRAGGSHLKRIADDIAKRTGGKLHAVVATHRHADHINGFATTDQEDGPGDVIRRLAPELVIQPWTEDPRAARDAHRATRTLPPGPSYIRRLDGMNRFAEALLKHLAMSGASLSRARGVSVRAIRELEFLGADNLPNLSAVTNLARMARARAGQKYVAFGDDCGLGALLPGVTVRVLGPPTREQYSGIEKQRRTDKDEYWLRALELAESIDHGAARRLFPRAPRYGRVPPEARRLSGMLGSVRAEQVRAIVRELDSAMNNTSVILLVEVGDEKLLFPGDAQLENWVHALRHAKSGGNPISAEVRAALRDVTVYKVGHHGSLNGTPKSLWDLFKNRGPAGKDRRLRTLLSTQPGKHGHADDGTEVPRGTLVEALERDSRVYTTTALKGKDLFVDIEIPVGKVRGTAKAARR